MHMVMAWGYYKLFHGIREQQYVNDRLSPANLAQFIPSMNTPRTRHTIYHTYPHATG